MLCVFFFFKQKTAYEMRISDWSSDVCSSDLLPRPWEERSEYQLFQDSLAQIELADRLGYDYAWEVEHHFMEEYSHSSAPEVFLGAASQRTKNIRLGHGIIQLTTNKPHRVAERTSEARRVGRGCGSPGKYRCMTKP